MALSVRTEKPESDYVREMTFGDRKGAQPLVSGQFLGLSEACESSAPLLPVRLDPPHPEPSRNNAVLPLP